MLRNTIAAVPVALLCFGGTAHSSEGNCRPIGGLPAPSARYCVADEVGGSSGRANTPKAPSQIRNNDNPPCQEADGGADAIARMQRQRIGMGATAGGIAGASVSNGAPLGAIIGGVLGGATASGVNAILDERQNVAACALLCVIIPPGARNINAYGWITPIPWRTDVMARCELGRGDCNGSYAGFTRMARSDNGDTTVCTFAKNWSHTDQRQAGLRVEYDR